MNNIPTASGARIAIFTICVVALGNIFGLNYQALQGIGGLLFILSPALITIIMRTFTKDGWADAGFGYRRGQVKILLAALLLFPLVFFFAIASGTALGFVQFEPDAFKNLTIAILTGVPMFLLFAISEEFAWRGYLEPKLAALGMTALPRHLLVGLIWSIWHIGYVISETSQSTLPPLLYALLFLISCFAMAVIYGQWRAKTGSFWPAAIAHCMANSLAWPLLTPEIIKVDAPLWFAARPEGFVALATLCLLAVIMFVLRKNGT
ncbi:CPBP family intramembrane glutamic endopeptidase [Lentilitoribacter sp. Alg239-R112]|uniref:CPBP family intramembrane glutamic endopeptidase n=1 Tax=Lentilitoribacter sp. Alg239-R112 TaxID=2305987 RepID=UPI0013A6CBBC|nr:CPBP family intramembrane glutamic endopeptidase [Lentilitoribacter sp. Alg239-R112]